jgi:hypothetical protein
MVTFHKNYCYGYQYWRKIFKIKNYKCSTQHQHPHSTMCGITQILLHMMQKHIWRTHWIFYFERFWPKANMQNFCFSVNLVQRSVHPKFYVQLLNIRNIQALLAIFFQKTESESISNAIIWQCPEANGLEGSEEVLTEVKQNQQCLLMVCSNVWISKLTERETKQLKKAAGKENIMWTSELLFYKGEQWIRGKICTKRSIVRKTNT